MSWYRTGKVTAAAGKNIITGTGTQWANNVMGIAPGQALIVPRPDGNTLIYEILAVDSDTKIRINGNIVDVLTSSGYGIQTSVSNSYSALARETSAQLGLYQQLLKDWQDITTGTGNVTIIAPDGSTVVIPSLAKISQDLSNSALPVGVPVPWPSATPPTGWLKCNGAAFTTSQYPKLALAYPALRLPDLRGEFIRGWDDGRGVDSGRNLLSAQSDAIQNIVGTFGRTQLFKDSVYSGPFRQDGVLLSVGLAPSDGSTGYGANNWSFDASRSVRTAAETRARNIAFNYIVRAA